MSPSAHPDEPEVISSRGILLMAAAAAGAVLLVSAALQWLLSSRGRAPRADLAHMLPKNAAAFAAFPCSALGYDDLPAAWRGLARRLAGKAVIEMSESLRVKHEEIGKMWAEVAAVEAGVLPGRLDAWGAGDEPVVVALRFVSAESLQAFLRKHAALNEPMTVRGGQTYRISPSLFLTPRRDTLLLTRSLGQMERVLSQADADSLARTAVFERAAAYGRREGAAWGVLNPAACRLPAGAGLAADAPRAAPAAAFGFKRFAGGLRGAGIMTPGRESAGLAEVWATWRNASERRLLAFAPADARWFVSLTVSDAAECWRRVRRLALQVSPKEGLRTAFEAAEERLQREYALDLGRDLLPLLTGEALVMGVKGKGGADGVVAAFALADGAAMSKVLAGVETSPALRRVSYEDRPCGSARIRAAVLDEGPSFAVAGQTLLASNRAAALEAALEARAGKNGLPASPAFAAVRRDLPASCALLAGVAAGDQGWLLLAAGPTGRALAVSFAGRWSSEKGAAEP